MKSLSMLNRLAGTHKTPVSILLVGILAFVLLGFYSPAVAEQSDPSFPSSPSAPAATCPSGGQCFADVPPGSPFYEHANNLYEQEIVSGYPCGGPGEPCDSFNRPYYRPANDVTRAQMTKFVDLARKQPGIFIDTSSQSIPLYSRSTAAGGTGLWGESNSGTGVLGFSTTGPGISGYSVSGTGVYGSSNSGQAGKFDGDVQVLGELTREYAPGTTNRAGPIAYAYIYGSGTVVSGTPNLTSTYNSEASRYEITIADEFYINYNYVAVVTPAYSVTPSGAGTPIIPRTYSSGAKLVVYLYNLSGALVTSDFQVVVYKP